MSQSGGPNADAGSAAVTGIDRRYMLEAIVQAEHGRYSAAPNPAVGCVVVRDDAVVGRGAHRRAGSAHAEVEALHEAGERARGATAYVTLEPCNHHGRTPPCVDALLDAGIARMVFAVADEGAHSGGGTARLAAAGIEIVGGVRAQAARELMRAFLFRQRHQRPHVRVKLAMSLDGAVALASGESQWITGEAARADVQRLRAESCAVLTGIGTVLADDPALTVRDARFDMHGRQPDRIVLDSDARMSPRARMLDLAGTTHVLTANSDSEAAVELAARGAQVSAVAAEADGLDIAAVAAFLRGQDYNQVLVEAGPRVAGTFLDAGLCDELLVYIAPKLLGREARRAFDLASPARLAAARGLAITDSRRVGEDQLLILKPSV